MLPDFQELGCCQLGQVQVRGLLLRASHGKPLLEILSRSALSPGAARFWFSLWGCAPRCLYRRPGAAPHRAIGRGRAHSGNRAGRGAARAEALGFSAGVPGGLRESLLGDSWGACWGHHILFGGNGRGCSCLPFSLS